MSLRERAPDALAGGGRRRGCLTPTPRGHTADGALGSLAQASEAKRTREATLREKKKPHAVKEERIRPRGKRQPHAVKRRKRLIA